ncbi:hypothetical protein ACFROC_19790 [Nocardia tengchongensis]|uniref:hypothetical protein n=1 Tax=Nocardia tengchongensis TaxID=2055889 RepID=UPI0036C0D3B1
MQQLLDCYPESLRKLVEIDEFTSGTRFLEIDLCSMTLSICSRHSLSRAGPHGSASGLSVARGDRRGRCEDGGDGPFWAQPLGPRAGDDRPQYTAPRNPYGEIKIGRIETTPPGDGND